MPGQNAWAARAAVSDMLYVAQVHEPGLSSTSLDPSVPATTGLKDINCCNIITKQMNQLAAELQHPRFDSSNGINGF